MKAKSKDDAVPVLARIFCGMIGLGESETRLLIGSHQKILTATLYQGNDKNEFRFMEVQGKKTTTWSVKATSLEDEYDAPSA